MKNNNHWKIAIILIIGLGWRLVALDQSLWLDEAIEWWAVKSFGLKELLTGYMIGDFNPPLHHILMWFWVRVFGESEIALRLPSVIFGVGIVWWVYKIASLIRPGLAEQGRAFPELAAGMAAVNGLLIYYSQEARMYAMAGFFTAGAMYWFLKANKSNKDYKNYKKDFLWFVIFMTLALYSHYLTWLLLPFVAVWGLRYVLPVLATIPWWPMLAKQLAAGVSAAGNPVWASLSRTNFKNLALVAVKFVTGRVPWPEGWWGQVAVGGAALAFWLAVIIGGIRVIREIRQIGQIRDRRLMLTLWAFGPPALGAAIGLFIPVFTYFRFLFVLPPMLILLAAGVNQLGRLGKFVKLGGLGVMLVFGGWYLLIPENQREDWRGAVAQLHRQEESPMVIIHPAVRPPFEYYDKGESLIVERPGLAAARPGLNRHSIWYIPYAQAIFDPEDSTRKFLMAEGYVRTFEKHFRGVTLERWDIEIATASIVIVASQ